MSKLTKQAYKQLMDEYCEDVRNWLPNMIGQVESDHICQILQASVDHEYPSKSAINRLPGDWAVSKIHQYVMHKFPWTEIEMYCEHPAYWNVYHRYNGESHQLHVGKAMLNDWEQRQNRESA